MDTLLFVNLKSCLSDKVVIITGASSGIGAETAVFFSMCGARVVLTARDWNGLETTVHRCQEEAAASSDKIMVVPGDLTESSDISNIISTTVETYGHIDILVNNAGAAIAGGYLDTTEEDLEAMLNINVKAVFMLCKGALPHLIAQKGCIVNVSSIAALCPTPKLLSFSVAKAAVDQLTKCLALEVANQGVRVNAVNPSVVLTPGLAKPGNLLFGADQTTVEEFIEKSCKMQPTQRLCDAREVAQVVAWLSSELASYVNGVCLPVDGGQHNVTLGCMPPNSPLAQV